MQQRSTTTRRIDSVRLLECFGQGNKECGEFAEIWFSTQNADGFSVREGMVLKRDNEAFACTGIDLTHCSRKSLIEPSAKKQTSSAQMATGRRSSMRFIRKLLSGTLAYIPTPPASTLEYQVQA